MLPLWLITHAAALFLSPPGSRQKDPLPPAWGWQGPTPACAASCLPSLPDPAARPSCTTALAQHPWKAKLLLMQPMLLPSHTLYLRHMPHCAGVG